MRYLAHLRGPRALSVRALLLGASVIAASPALAEDMRGGFTLRPLDGATIRAVEKHVNPNSNTLGLTLGVLPFDPYYLGLEGVADYMNQFDETMGWEILNAAYVFPVDKALLQRLAEINATDPNTDRLTYLVTTNIFYAFAYGKALLFKDFIRYFRASGLAGLGVAGSTLRTQFGLDFGFRFEFYAAESLSWRVEYRNLVTISSDSSSYGTFRVGIGIGL